MRVVFLSFFIYGFLHATNLLTYNIYNNPNEVAIRLAFDTPYNGQIFKRSENGATSLTFLDLKYDKTIQKSLDSKILENINIEPIENGTIITLKSPQKVGVFASKNADNLALRISVEPINPKLSSTPLPKKPQTISSSLDLQSDIFSKINKQYIIVVSLLFVLLIFTYWLKSKVKSKNKKSWLFKSSPKNINVLTHKMLDGANKVSLLEYNGVQYLVLTGNSNIILDKFNSPNQAKDDDDFEAMFEQNRKKLDNYLKLGQPSQLDSYKKKASKDYALMQELKS